MKVVMRLTQAEGAALLLATSSRQGGYRSTPLVSAMTRLRTAVREAQRRAEAVARGEHVERAEQEQDEAERPRPSQDAQAAALAVGRVLALHAGVEGGNCAHCWDAWNDEGIPWPCQTVQAVLAVPLHGPAPH